MCNLYIYIFVPFTPVRSIGPHVQSLAKRFPIENEETLLEINGNINIENRNEHIEAINSIISPSGIIKNLKNVLFSAVTYAYNIDWVQRKKSLKGLNNFYKVLLESMKIY